MARFTGASGRPAVALFNRKVFGITKRLPKDIANAVIEGVTGEATGVAGIAAAIGSAVGNSTDLRRAHEVIADRMREAMLVAYEVNVQSRELDYSERDSLKRLKGKLRPALENPEMFKVGPSGIQFVNASILYSEAAHFARLNFGTHGIGAESGMSPAVHLRLFGQVVAEVSFDEGPRPGFAIPAGLFFGPSIAGGKRGEGDRTGPSRWLLPSMEARGTGVFYPISELPNRQLQGRAARFRKNRGDVPTHAIQARRFLEAGLAEMAVALPQVYDLMIQKWLNESTEPGSAGEAYLDHIKVPGGTRRIKTYSSPSLRVR